MRRRSQRKTAARKAIENGMRQVEVFVKGPGARA
jgi:SSU ribosomal protein S11P